MREAVEGEFAAIGDECENGGEEEEDGAGATNELCVCVCVCSAVCSDVYHNAVSRESDTHTHTHAHTHTHTHAYICI